MNKKGLDEMQLQKRNSIGEQAFTMLLYLLVLDVVLYGFGVRWIGYPANVMVILSICAGVYVIRLIAANAFVGPSPGSQKLLLKVVLTLLVPVLVSAAILLFLINNVSFSGPGNINDISAPLLFVTSGIAILIAAVAFAANEIKNRADS